MLGILLICVFQGAIPFSCSPPAGLKFVACRTHTIKCKVAIFVCPLASAISGCSHAVCNGTITALYRCRASLGWLLLACLYYTTHQTECQYFLFNTFFSVTMDCILAADPPYYIRCSLCRSPLNGWSRGKSNGKSILMCQCAVLDCSRVPLFHNAILPHTKSKVKNEFIYF